MTQRSRREVLTALATTAVAGLAGCNRTPPDNTTPPQSSTPPGANTTSTANTTRSTETTTRQTTTQNPAEKDYDRVDSLPHPFQGHPDANLTVDVFMDLSADGSRNFLHEVKPKLYRDYIAPQTAKLRFFDYPLPADQWSFANAMAARAVQDEGGMGAFWTFIEGLVKQPTHSYDVYESLINSLAVDVNSDRVAAKVEQGVYLSVVQDGRLAAEQRGVNRSPTVIVKGTKLVNPSYTHLQSQIEQAREQ